MRKATDRPIVIAIGIRETCEWVYGEEIQYVTTQWMLGRVGQLANQNRQVI